MVSVYGKERFVVNNKMKRKDDFELSPLRSDNNSEKIIYNFVNWKNLRIFPIYFFTGRGRNGKRHLSGRTAGSFSEDRPLGWDPVAAGNRAGDGMARIVSEEKAPRCPADTGSQNKPAQNPKIRTIACFNALKTYKTAKKFFLFLLCLFGGLRLLYGQNLLL